MNIVHRTHGQIEDWVLNWFLLNPNEMMEKDFELYKYARYWAVRLGYIKRTI